MARRKGNGKHAAKHQDMPVTAKTYSRDNYGSQARLNFRKILDLAVHEKIPGVWFL